jgi:hypothetical protein
MSHRIDMSEQRRASERAQVGRERRWADVAAARVGNACACAPAALRTRSAERGHDGPPVAANPRPLRKRGEWWPEGWEQGERAREEGRAPRAEAGRNLPPDLQPVRHPCLASAQRGRAPASRRKRPPGSGACLRARGTLRASSLPVMPARRSKRRGTGPCARRVATIHGITRIGTERNVPRTSFQRAGSFESSQ